MTTHASVIDSSAIKGITDGMPATNGVMGVATIPSGRGVYGIASTGSGINYGVYGRTLSTGGVGVLGIATAPTGINYGGTFTTLSTSGRGVSALASAHSGSNYGVFGESLSDQGTGVFGRSADNVGVFGIATGDTGINYGGSFQTNSVSGRAVYGLANANSGNSYAVRGYCVSPNGYAVYAAGDSGASGTKSFRIDHPNDPENKYLLHYSAESPMPQNFYVGNVVTDSKGYAWVQLPEYFQEINANFKYQLTVVDDDDSNAFVMAKVSKKIRGNRFQIRTNAPHIEVSWEVKADRNDLFVRRKHPKDVVEKVGVERGRYQHPELYGLGPEHGMDYDPDVQPDGAKLTPQK